MNQLMARLYDNIDEAKAFALSFTNFVYDYDDVIIDDYFIIPCKHCKRMIQAKDYLAPKANCKNPCGILTTFHFGVSIELRDQLMERFEIREQDFRPIRNKRGEIVYYQITPQHTMLPLQKENDWKTAKLCPQCGSLYYKDHHYENSKGEKYYYISQQALDEMHDINVTYECFSRFYIPRFVISRRVYNFLVERYPRTHYFPFYLKETT